ncbi:hypothetical protein KUCAC02_025111 [Chaenocephalus aceratus]|nr:hypothetical protein KUCAC02_033072 [Chaenocephalus aceratus]KAI4797382.1 hypothetical protein KUCAC02_025111 [Chaenocephalus aceratus]
MVNYLTRNEVIFRLVRARIPAHALRKTKGLGKNPCPEELIWKLNTAIGDANTWRMMMETISSISPGFEAGKLEDPFFWNRIEPALSNNTELSVWDLTSLLQDLTHSEQARVKVFLQWNLFEGSCGMSYDRIEHFYSSRLARAVNSHHGRGTTLVMAVIFAQLVRTDLILEMFRKLHLSC